MTAVVAGLQAAALMCGLTALVVLAGSVLQGYRERTDEAVLLKILGASKRQLLGHLIVANCQPHMPAASMGRGHKGGQAAMRHATSC